EMDEKNVSPSQLSGNTNARHTRLPPTHARPAVICFQSFIIPAPMTEPVRAPTTIAGNAQNTLATAEKITSQWRKRSIKGLRSASFNSDWEKTNAHPVVYKKTPKNPVTPPRAAPARTRPAKEFALRKTVCTIHLPANC